jgi:hypothetical protein
MTSVKFTLWFAKTILSLIPESNAFNSWAAKRRSYLKRKGTEFEKLRARLAAARFRKAHPEKAGEYWDAYYEEHKQVLFQNKKEFNKRNPEKVRRYGRNKQRNRRVKDPAYRIESSIRCRMRLALKGLSKSKNTLLLCGVSSWQELRAKIEQTFLPGFSWGNYGTVWHIDHKRPCASFDLSDPIQQAQCFHWSNLQALSVQENLSKGAKWNPEGK